MTSSRGTTARQRARRGRRVRAYVGLGANLGDAAGTLAAGDPCPRGAAGRAPRRRLAAVRDGTRRRRRPARVPQRRRRARRPSRPGPRDRGARAPGRAQGPGTRVRPPRTRALGTPGARPGPARLRPARAPRRAPVRRTQRRPFEARSSVAGGPPRRRPRAPLRSRPARRPGTRPASAGLGRDRRDGPARAEATEGPEAVRPIGRWDRGLGTWAPDGEAAVAADGSPIGA